MDDNSKVGDQPIGGPWFLKVGGPVAVGDVEAIQQKSERHSNVVRRQNYCTCLCSKINK